MEFTPVVPETDKPHPWRVLVTELVHEILPEHLETLLSLSKEQLGSWYDKCYESKNAVDFFDVIQSQLGYTHVVTYLKNVFEQMDFHINFGTQNVKKMIETYEDDMIEVKNWMNEHGIVRDDNFVGRSAAIKNISEHLSKEDDRKIGVVICGLGGMGKTTLAHEVCFQFRLKKTVLKVDLREKRKMTDLYAGILSCLDQNSASLDENQLHNLTVKYLSKIEQDTLFLFDNVDDLIEGDNHQMTYFLNFLKQLCALIDGASNKIPVQVIITSRQKILQSGEDYHTPVHKIQSFLGKMHEYELTCLEPEEALELFKRCSSLMAPMKDSDIQHVIRQCSYCPLAINLIAKWLEAEYGARAVPEKVLKQLDATGKEKRIKQCIQQSFKTLQERYQTILCQLTLFQSAPFHVDGAVTVLYADDTLTGNVTKCKLDMLLLKSKHLVEIENCSQSRTETDPSHFVMKNRQSVVKYSLHPFVYAFVKDESGKSKHKKLMVESKRRFYKHCKKIIYKSGKESNRNSLACLKILEDNRPHVIAFFDSLQNGETGVGCEGLDNKAMSMVHIAATAPGYMTSYDLINIFERQADVADTEKATADFVFFKSCAGISYLRLDWINKAEILRKQISDRHTALLSEVDPKLKNTAELMFALFCASLQMKQGSQNEALKTLKKAQDIVRNLDKKRHLLSLQLDTLNSIGCCYYKMRDFDRAVDQYDRALEMASKHVVNNRHFRIPHILVNKASAIHERAMSILKEDKEKGLIGLREAQECCESSLKVEQELNQDGTGNSGEKLALMSEIYKNLDELEKSLYYARQALSIRRKAFYPPHQDITISTYRVARTLHLMSKEAESEGNKEKSFNCNSEARTYYDETLRNITWGGLDRDYADYPFLKKEHMDVLTYVGMQGKLKKTEKKYKKFEDGEYEKKKKKSMKSMLRRHENASKLKKRMVSEISSSSSATSSSSDDENDDQYWNMNPMLMRQDSGCVDSITSSLASFRESLSEDVEQVEDDRARRRLQRQQSSLQSVDEDVFDGVDQSPETLDNADIALNIDM